MANDAFLKLQGISGSATDSKHKNWIEITSFSFSIQKPDDVLVKSTETKEGPHVSDVSISKKVDKTSPKLASAACDPTKSFTSATIALCGRCGNSMITVSTGGLPTYIEYKLTQVSIKSYTLNGGSGYATESLVLGFSEIEWKFTDGNITGKWSITDNEGS